jgi:protein gp37
MENSKIEWCDHTFNPWEGCTKVSPGCEHCYAEARNARYAGGKAPNWGKGTPRRRTSASNWAQPLKWNRVQEVLLNDHIINQRPRVFCASLADWLDDEVPIEWLADLLELIARTPELDWLLLTKRPEKWRDRIAAACISAAMGPQHEAAALCHLWLQRTPPANVWIGTTVEDQTRADERIPALLKIPARVRFLSCEPLLGPVNLMRWIGPKRDCGHYSNVSPYSTPPGTIGFGDGGCTRPENPWAESGNPASRPGAVSCTPKGCPFGYIGGINWVICGGESGLDARPMHPDWAISLRDQCNAAAVPFLFKQWGEWTNSVKLELSLKPDIYLDDDRSDGIRSATGMWKVGKKAAGREIYGIEYNGFPEVRA